MKRLLNTEATVMLPGEAARMVAKLQAGDDEWKYSVKRNPKGVGYVVAIHDESGEFVSYWTE